MMNQEQEQQDGFDENMSEALHKFIELAQQAKARSQSGQIIFYLKDGEFESWSAPNTGRLRRVARERKTA